MSAGGAADGYVQTAWRLTERQGEMEKGREGGVCVHVAWPYVCRPILSCTISGGGGGSNKIVFSIYVGQI